MYQRSADVKLSNATILMQRVMRSVCSNTKQCSKLFNACRIYVGNEPGSESVSDGSTSSPGSKLLDPNLIPKMNGF